MTRDAELQPTPETERVPLATAALRLAMNRERLLRRIQSGEIRGEQVDGRWFVDAREVSR